jgi:hypothetical protein
MEPLEPGQEVEVKEPKKAKKEKAPKAPKVVLTPEERKARRQDAAKKILEKRQNQGVAAKQFFIHKSLFKKAEEVMAPIIAESKALIANS